MMAMYQLCRAKAAKHPFYIERIDINIYTIEELCFYLWKNVSLLDESILNEKLCDWLEGELGMQRLAFHLREKLKDAESIAELVLPVFREVRYLNAAEMYAVKEQIGKLEVQTEDIRRKIRADLLVNYGMYSGAVSLYRQILQNRNQGKTGLQFYAGVLSNMAGAYGRMFLFREAADCLWQSYEMVRSNAVYRSYLAILPLYLSEEDYKKRLEELKVPKEQLDKIEEEKQEVLAKAEKMQKIENAGQETLARFLQEEKRKYHKSRR